MSSEKAQEHAGPGLCFSLLFRSVIALHQFLPPTVPVSLRSSLSLHLLSSFHLSSPCCFFPLRGLVFIPVPEKGSVRGSQLSSMDVKVSQITFAQRVRITRASQKRTCACFLLGEEMCVVPAVYNSSLKGRGLKVGRKGAREGMRMPNVCTAKLQKKSV